MEIGSLVRARAAFKYVVPYSSLGRAGQELTTGHHIGLVLAFRDVDPIVYWNETFPEEWEYRHQLEEVPCST